ncbi:hypothetical protein PIB30_084744 [Stylosanthes scabra]|uniref:Uncharacterized protein n=1 Tax=Stylosanthes scabra TaxID=79078 RepID=A0ABU6SSV0_9FABA|nr:hypothetical protein [Stylosanthes scabra]
MEGTYSYDQGYTPWNPPPYQHYAPQYNAYQSNGFDPPPPYPPYQTGFEEAFQLLYKERKELRENQRRISSKLTTLHLSILRFVIQSANSNFNNSSITSQTLNSGDLSSQALSIPRRSIHTLFLCANEEGREDTPLNEEDIENLNHEEDKEQKGIEIVHSASSEATLSKLPSELQFEWVNLSNLNFIGPQHYGLLETDGQLKALCGVLDKKKEDSVELGSEFKAYNGHLHKLYNNRAKVRASNLKKHLGPWQSQEKLVYSQRNGWTNQVWDPGKSYKNQLFWGVTTYIGTFRDLLNMNWNPIENTKFKHWWGFKEKFKHKPP